MVGRQFRRYAVGRSCVGSGDDREGGRALSNHEKEIQELRERLPQTFSGADYIANYQLDLVAKIAYRGEALERWMQTGPVPLSKDVREIGRAHV